jgi:hypothetical protein
VSIRSCTCIAWVTVFVFGCAGYTIGQTEPLTLEDSPAVFPVSNGGAKVADRSESSTTPTESSSAESDTDDPASVTNAVQPEARVSDRFQWKPALAQALFGTGIYHGWRYAHESGTRDALYGHWFQDWMASIGETRGWDDSDGWHASYVSHPFEGGIFGFIEQQNDPLYREVEWGDGRVYWMSRLRALTFSAIMSTQWTLGPASEASLGNVQLHASPGFIDLVLTSTLGVGEMMGEDMLDRYVIMPMENHTANPWFIMAARSVANPARTFANMMALKEPWSRATRPGIFGNNHEMRKQLVKEYKDGESGAPFAMHTAAEREAMNAAANPNADKPRPLEAPIELNAYAQYESFLGGGSCVGAGGVGAARVNPDFQIVAEANGCLVINMPKDNGGDSEMFAVGPRWTPRAAHKFSPFAEVLVGARRITHDITDVTKKKQLTKEWEDGLLKHDFLRSDYSVQYQAMGFAMKVGAGFDAVFARAFAWRVLDVGYTHSWLNTVEPINASQGVTISSGLVLRIGTW